MSDLEETVGLSEAACQQLLGLVREVVHSGAQGQDRGRVEEAGFVDELHRSQASFVTLSQADGQLRGCCGSLEPKQTLLVDLAENAWRTAFADPRFSPVQAREFKQLTVEIALLSALSPLEVSSRGQLLRALVPERDGLLISAGAGHRATFLPKVWRNLPRADHFVDQLFRKAGLVEWPDQLSAWIYSTEVFSGPLSAPAKSGR